MIGGDSSLMVVKKSGALWIFSPASFSAFTTAEYRAPKERFFNCTIWLVKNVGTPSDRTSLVAILVYSTNAEVGTFVFQLIVAETSSTFFTERPVISGRIDFVVKTASRLFPASPIFPREETRK